MPATSVVLPEGCAFHWAGGSVLYGRVLHVGVSPVGGAIPESADPLPAWTLGPSAVPDPEPYADLHLRLCAWLSGSIRRDDVRWSGSMTLCSRVLSCLDALVTSASVELPPTEAWQRAMARFSPAPGGALEGLLILAWLVALGWASEVAGAISPDDAASPDAVRSEVDHARSVASDIAPVPAWPLPRWSGDPRNPPRVGNRIEILLPGLVELRAAQRLTDRVASARAAMFSMMRDRDRHPSPGLDPRGARALSRAGRALRTYQDVASRVLRGVVGVYRLAGHIRFRLDRLADRALTCHRSRPEARQIRIQLTRLGQACSALSDADPFILHGLLHEARSVCVIEPAWLVASEGWLAALWDRHAACALRDVWGVAPGAPDGPDVVVSRTLVSG